MLFSKFMLISLPIVLADIQVNIDKASTQYNIARYLYVGFTYSCTSDSKVTTLDVNAISNSALTASITPFTTICNGNLFTETVKIDGNDGNAWHKGDEVTVNIRVFDGYNQIVQPIEKDLVII